MSNDYLPPQRLETKLITAKLLKEKYTADINSEVYGNNWYLGCSDLAGLAPYIRIVMDRLFRGDGKRHLIFDVGANNGQDASTILGIFQPVIGMCEGMLSNNVKVISVEPSPKVFCELEDLVKERKWTNSQILRLNIGLSDTSGVFQFADPGHEGGSLNTTSKVTNITHDTNRGGGMSTSIRSLHVASRITVPLKLTKGVRQKFPPTLWMSLSVLFSLQLTTGQTIMMTTS